MTSYAKRISLKIEHQFSPTSYKLIDESHKHAGHGGARPEGETHFYLEVVSDVFEGLNRVQRHQRVYECLADELAEHVHALRLKTRTPGE